MLILTMHSTTDIFYVNYHAQKKFITNHNVQ